MRQKNHFNKSQIHWLFLPFFIPFLCCQGPSEKISGPIVSKREEPLIRPLLSWNDNSTKTAISDFVKEVTRKGDNFVKEEDRIAVFDNDGTLWAEQPMYFQFLFALDKVKIMSAQHPEWKNKQPFKAVLEGDVKTLAESGEKGIIEIVMATHSGMSTEEFSKEVKSWIDTATHPKLKRKYKECVYQPMLELIQYLKVSGFKIYIVSGGGIEFIRPWSEEVYGIPPEQVIGSSIKTRYEVRDGKPMLIRIPEVNFINDKDGKPVGINQYIGRKPIAAFGNSDGDFQMLEWTMSGEGKRLAMIVHHDDASREWSYDRQSAVGKLDRALDEAPKRNWILISMKNDWSNVFPEK